MRRRLLFLPLLAIAGILFGGSGTESPPSASPAELDRIIRLWAAATGGLDHIRAIRSLRMTGRITFGSNAPVPITIEIARPGKIRTEVRFPEGSWIQLYDGRQGWTVSPFSKSSPQPMTPDQLANAPEQADIDGPLVDSARKGIRLALEGKESVDGKDAWRIRVTRADGVVRHLDLDASTSLKVRWEGELGEGSDRKTNASLFSDYRSVGGLSFPFRIVSGLEGGPVGQEIALEKIDVDPAIPDSDFTPAR